MTTKLHERLRRQIEDCFNDPEIGPDIAQALLDRIDQTCLDHEIEQTLSERLEFDIGANEPEVVGTVTGDSTPAEGSQEGSMLSMLKATFDATADGILVVDLDGNYVTSNRVFHDMWRIPRHMLHCGQEEAVAKFALALVKNPESVLEQAIAPPATEIRDEVEGDDGVVLSWPPGVAHGTDDGSNGRNCTGACSA